MQWLESCLHSHIVLWDERCPSLTSPFKCVQYSGWPRSLVFSSGGIRCELLKRRHWEEDPCLDLWYRRWGLDERRGTYLFSWNVGFFESLFDNEYDFLWVMVCSLSWEEASAWRRNKCFAGVGKDVAFEVHDAYIVRTVPTPTLLADPSIPNTYLGLSSSIYLL